jgi:hypothetical protein
MLIEANEVPNIVFDAYAEKHAPRFAELLAKADRYTTVTPDRIQLDPWIAWPTLHRGVNDETHGILRLGQDTSHADKNYPPIWNILKNAGFSVGVWGSLFSSCETDLGGYPFFVPDVFSSHDRVEPAYLQKFQSFNLAMTRASARNVDGKVASGGGKAMMELALARRFRADTLARVAKQMVGEKLDKKMVSRRRNIQTDLHADLFLDAIKRNRVDFGTFYTNNVAAAMHRFWSASIPGADLNKGRLEDEWIDAYAGEVFAALESVERLIARLQSGNYGSMTIMVGSALGQEEIPAENYNAFLTVIDLKKFAARLVGDGVEDVEFESVPTMVPDFTMRFASTEAAAAMNDRLAGFTIGDYRAIETLERMQNKELVGSGPRMSFIRHHYEHDVDFKHAVTFKRSDANTIHLSLQIDNYSGAREAMVGNSVIAFDDLGLGFVSHDEGVNCTAQHCAEGSLFVLNPAERQRITQPEVSILDVAPSILGRFGLPVPAYMLGEQAIGL